MRPRHALTKVLNHWFGCDDAAIAPLVVIMERNRIGEFSTASGAGPGHEFRGVFSGATVEGRSGAVTLVAGVSSSTITDCLHLLREAGARRVASVGTAGGLVGDVGDVIVATESGQYADPPSWPVPGESWQPGVLSRSPSGADGESLREVLGNAGVGAHVGPLFTVPAVCWETPLRLTALRDRGYVGVDMESAPFFRAAAAFGMESVCVRWISDLPIRPQFAMTVPLWDAEPVHAKRQTAWENWPDVATRIISTVWLA